MILKKRIRERSERSTQEIVWRFCCCVELTQQQQQREQQKQKTIRFVFCCKKKGTSEVFDLFQRLPRRGNKESCVGDLEISQRDQVQHTRRRKERAKVVLVLLTSNFLKSL